MHRLGLVGKFFCVGLGIAVFVGCATGLEEDPSGISDLKSEPLDSGVDPDAPSTKLPGPGSSSGNPEEDSGTGEDSSTDAGTVDSGTDSGTVTPPPPPPPPSCTAPAACVGATDLGSMSGDQGAGVKSATGSTSQWFKVRLSEDDSDVFGTSMQVRATLISPAGSNFDLYMYLAGNTSAVECSAVSRSSTTTGTDVVSQEWGETGTFSNGDDDDRWVTIEVRHVSGTCSASNKWTLTVNGNAL